MRSEGEFTQTISLASFNVPSGLHASPTGVVLSLSMAVLRVRRGFLLALDCPLFESGSLLVFAVWARDLGKEDLTERDEMPITNLLAFQGSYLHSLL